MKNFNRRRLLASVALAAPVIAVSNVNASLPKDSPLPTMEVLGSEVGDFYLRRRFALLDLPDYFSVVSPLMGRVNNRPFLGFPPGYVKVIGGNLIGKKPYVTLDFESNRVRAPESHRYEADLSVLGQLGSSYHTTRDAAI